MANSSSREISDNLRGLLFTIYKVPSLDEQETCMSVRLLPDDARCNFVQTSPDCQTESSFVPYLYLLFCEFDASSRYLGVLVCVLWLVLMFYLLGKSANDFFCPALTVIARVLGLSENLAGVTVLAFGNGSPDIFTSLVGAPRGRSQLVYGELIGSGLFVTTVIAGAICTMRPFQLMERPFLRDVIFYLGAAYWTFYIFYKGEATTWEAIGFILLYVVYITVVLAERIISKPPLPAAVVAEDEWKSSSIPSSPTTSPTMPPLQTLTPTSRKSGSPGPSEERESSTSPTSPPTSPTMPSLQPLTPTSKKSGSPGPSEGHTSSTAGMSLEASSRSLPESSSPRRLLEELDDDLEGGGGHPCVPVRRTRSHTVSTLQELAIHHERLQELWAQGLSEEARLSEVENHVACYKSELKKNAPLTDERTPLLGGHAGAHHGPGLWAELRAGLSVSLPGSEESDSEDSVPRGSWWSLPCRVLAVLQLPVVMALKLLVPVVNYTAPRHAWCRPLNALHCLTCPLFCVLATQVAFVWLTPWLPLWAVVVTLGSAMALIVLCTTRHDRPPKYHNLFAFLGFAGSVVTIYMVANEVVNLLRAIGILTHYSDTLLGMTVLAWGNSIGDFITNFSIARQGFERMGFSACYGGPLFNILLGIGISFTMATIESGEHKITIQYGEVGPLLAAFLALSLISSLVAFPLMRFTARRSYGFYLLGLYAAFLACAALLEAGWWPQALIPGSTSDDSGIPTSLP